MLADLLSRRNFLVGGLLFCCGTKATVAEFNGDAAPPLFNLVLQPLLVQSLYRVPVGTQYAPNGAAGANRKLYRWIEEQRQGAEWITRRIVCGNADWISVGWRELDWGIGHQQQDGGFGSADPFHSTSFFVEALARGCLLDQAHATPARTDALRRAASWLMRPEVEGRGTEEDGPFTHRRYILAAALSEAAEVTGELAFAAKAESWAADGLLRQRGDGTNPERDGYDAGYQMVGVLMALRYLSVCQKGLLRTQLRAMIWKAVQRELGRLRPDGSIDASGSTRIERERDRSGQIKVVPYGVILEGLVYGAMSIPEPSWLEPARRIAIARGWLK